MAHEPGAANSTRLAPVSQYVSSGRSSSGVMSIGFVGGSSMSDGSIVDSPGSGAPGAVMVCSFPCLDSEWVLMHSARESWPQCHATSAGQSAEGALVLPCTSG